MQENAQGRKLVITLYLYWIIQVVVQNVFKITKTSSGSNIIKIVLLVYLIFGLIKGKISFSSKNMTIWFLFAVYALISFSMLDKGKSLESTIYYLFPVLLSFLVFVNRSDRCISEDDLFLFFKLTLYAVLCICVYTLIFQTEKYGRAITASSAYGSELTAIFISNHEFGMYLTFAITSAMMLYQRATKATERFLYITFILIFAVNMILTFSRTSYLATLIIVTLFVVLSKNKGLKKWYFAAVIIGLMVVLASGKLREYIQLVLFKETKDAGRFDMWEYYINYYKQSPLSVKLFGSGYSEVGKMIQNRFNHSSVHNSFLQILLIWGASGLIACVLLIVSCMRRAVLIYRNQREYALLFFILIISAISFMYTNTSCLMISPIDSFFLTVFTVIIPRYFENNCLQE